MNSLNIHLFWKNDRDRFRQKTSQNVELKNGLLHSLFFIQIFVPKSTNAKSILINPNTLILWAKAFGVFDLTYKLDDRRVPDPAPPAIPIQWANYS
jgi:hypothetical protein